MSEREFLKQVIFSFGLEKREIDKRWGNDPPDIPKRRLVIIGEVIKNAQKKMVALNNEGDSAWQAQESLVLK